MLFLCLTILAGCAASCAAQMKDDAVVDDPPFVNTSNDESGAPPSGAGASEESQEERTVETERIALSFGKNDLIATGIDSNTKNGKRVTYACWVSTDYIDVSSYAALRYELAAHRYLYTVSFFDENKKFLSGSATESIMGFTVLVGHTAVPEGAKYARFVNFTGSGEYPNIMDDPFVEGFASAEDYDYYKTRVLRHDGLKIVCLGDSLTEGDFGLAPGVGNKHYLNYPYYLAKIMGCDVVNQGRCGYTAADYCSLFGGGSINVSDADIVLIMLGTNGGLTYSGKQQLASYKDLVSAVKKRAKDGCRVILLTPPHATVDPKRLNYGYAPLVDNAAEEVRKLAESKKYDLIDVYAESPITPEMEDLYQPVDGLHLSAAGYEALARFLAEKIELLLAK